MDSNMITKNFSMEELVASNTARMKGIDNTPDKEVEARLVQLAQQVLQPLRDSYGKPIKISSGYRCQALNKAIGGVSTSQHLKGEAVDINNGQIENKKLFLLASKMIKEGVITVGQLIDEKGYKWLHISLPDNKHRNQILHL